MGDAKLGWAVGLWECDRKPDGGLCLCIKGFLCPQVLTADILAYTDPLGLKSWPGYFACACCTSFASPCPCTLASCLMMSVAPKVAQKGNFEEPAIKALCCFCMCPQCYLMQVWMQMAGQKREEVERAELKRRAEPPPKQYNMGQSVMVQQATSQFCRILCCQPNIDWHITDFKEDYGNGDELPARMFIKENAGFVGRSCSCCYPGARSTKYNVHCGNSEAGPIAYSHEKAWSCSACPLMIPTDSGALRCPCCFCLPYLETRDEKGDLLGSSEYICDGCIFVPKYSVMDKLGKPIFLVRPDTCIGGLCVKCKCGGKRGKCFRVPYVIREPRAPYSAIGNAAITDMWAGLKNECCTKKDVYAVTFPKFDSRTFKEEDIEAAKKVLIGTTLLVDITMNEQDT